MNKAIWWVIGIVVVIGLIYYVSTKDQVDTGEVENEELGSSLDQGSNNQRSLVELLAMGTSQKCAFGQTVNGSVNEGQIYISNGKMRGDFSAAANGQTMMAHMISDGEDMYTWLDGMNIGFKLSMGSTQAPVPGAAANGSLDVNQKLDYDCAPSTVAASQFTLPSGVQFSALGEAGVVLPPTQ
mgnify:CR=1 FL=1